MNKYLSISEVSKLLGISIHNIRYYEKEGLLDVPRKTEKGYRLYSFKDIEILSGIMFLRHSELPIKTIKDLVDDYKPEDYQMYLKQSSQNLDEEIKRLTKAKEDIDKVLKDSLNNHKDLYTIYKDARYLLPIKTTGYDDELSERDFYNFFNEGDNKVSSLDILAILKDDEIIYGIVNKDRGLEISSGNYLCHRFLVDGIESFNKEAEVFLTYLYKHKIQTEGDLLLEEKAMASFNYKEVKKSVFEYQIKVL